ncbi:trypsin-like serine protease [Streptomyces sedi]|uniref:S1 family peptidase n=1 Tax=Streptomyces sedi TaxID=555059 RepID=A0A5C4UUX7_9ACTN|nr:trypsin-like serine protease [Streptomyces sedi]TNM27460.1 S1 family peptidase [Streptomyces sedi]
MDPRRLALLRCGTARQRHSTGSGYLVAPRLVLTARHVLVDRHTGVTWPEIHVTTGHPGAGDTARTRARVAWMPQDDPDVALLRLDDPVEVPGSVRWGHPVGRTPLRYEGLGFPLASSNGRRDAEHLRGDLPPLSSGVRDCHVLDQDPVPEPREDGRAAWAGVSGAAIFCDDHLVGVVVENYRSYGTRRLLACSAKALLGQREFHECLQRYGGEPPRLVEVGAPLPKAPLAGEFARVGKMIEQVLWPMLGGPETCAAHGRALAHQLGARVPAGYAPSLDDLLALIAAHPRALATLSGSLSPVLGNDVERARLTALLARVRALGFGAMLSYEEHEQLLDLLRGICAEQPSLIPRCAREALRYGCLPEVLSHPLLRVEDLETAVEAGETLPDSSGVRSGSSPVPALLRLTEHIAAAVADERTVALRSWANGVADRMGIRPEALDERRADAEDWALQQLPPVIRVVLELSADEEAADERYLSRILLARHDGTHTVLREPETVSRTPQEVARRLRDAVEGVTSEPGQEEHVPWVTILVGREGLRLAVDEWNPGPPNEFVPEQPIGVEYRLTLSCPEMSKLVATRDRDQRRRWAGGRSRTLVTDPSCASSRQLTRVLQHGHRDATRVVLHGTREQRTSLLQVCLALGVPVVLWDREADSYEDAPRLRTLDPTGPLADLPERVRKARGEAFDAPAVNLPRPALVWEQESSPEPRILRLRDPEKGSHLS